MNYKIFVFRTSASKRSDLQQINRVFREYPQISKWNVDFEDWEKILRIECKGISAGKIITLLRNIDIYAQELM